jgi:hypothetical protein
MRVRYQGHKALISREAIIKRSKRFPELELISRKSLLRLLEKSLVGKKRSCKEDKFFEVVLGDRKKKIRHSKSTKVSLEEE